MSLRVERLPPKGEAALAPEDEEERAVQSSRPSKSNNK